MNPGEKFTDGSYEAQVLADSVSPHGPRLFTIQATFPRFILAEVNTHRVFSRNSASSRAIPPEKLIERVRENPFVPETFNRRVKGMGVGAEVEDYHYTDAVFAWLESRDQAVASAEKLSSIGIDKSRINRLLEPFMWHTAIITSTEWDNFFALRCPPGEKATIDFPAQLEFQKIAILMRRAMRASESREVDYGQWHLPLIDPDEVQQVDPSEITSRTDEDAGWIFWARVSAGRCARVSFDTHENYEDPFDSYARQSDRLESNGHLSPAEHPATPNDPLQWNAKSRSNLRGWTQLRKLIPDEDNLVGVLEGRPAWWSTEAQPA